MKIGRKRKSRFRNIFCRLTGVANHCAGRLTCGGRPGRLRGPEEGSLAKDLRQMAGDGSASSKPGGRERTTTSLKSASTQGLRAQQPQSCLDRAECLWSMGLRWEDQPATRINAATDTQISGAKASSQEAFLMGAMRGN